MELTFHQSLEMAYQALYDFSSSHPFQMDQWIGKVVVQEKKFPSTLLQMPTRVRHVKTKCDRACKIGHIC